MKQTVLILIILISQSTLTNAAFEFVGDVVGHKVFENRVEFQLTNAKFNLYIFNDEVIRFRYTNQDQFSPAPSYAVIQELPDQTDFQFSEEEEFFKITTKSLTIEIKKKPCRVSIFDKEMNLINADDESFGVSFDDDEVRCHKQLLEGENFYGLGEKSDNLRKNGNQYTMWNTDYPAYTMRKDPLYVSIPFFMGIRNFKAYGIFFDNTYKSYFNMGASNNRFYWFGADQGEMDYYFMYGPEIKKVISLYTELTGRMELPPKWALGYQQSKWSYYPESTVRNIAENFRAREIPCDVIYLDIHYMDGYRVFTWDKNRFPNPTKMLSDLKGQGFKIITIIDPGVKADDNYFVAQEGLEKNLFAMYPDGIPYQGEVWPSWAYFPDFTNKETRKWWGDKLSVLLKEGIEGFWNDMNEPAVWGQNFPDIVQFDDNGFGASHKKIHNVYALQMAKATHDGLNRHSPDKRKFILTRAAFAGIQRYSAVWTGDNEATEEHLKLSCIMPQGLGISGVAFCGPDAGGFMGEPTAPLYTRWMQLGAFTPFFRGHTVIDTKAQEPWAFDEWTEMRVRDAIKLRYRFLPFWYNEFYKASRSGLPIMRPMFLNYQTDENCYSLDAQYQFMLGDNLLVAPVLSQYENFKKLYLPEGKWIDWNTNKTYVGKQWIIVEVPVDQIPLFIKEGGIIPMQESQEYVGQKQLKELEMVIFPSEKDDYLLYEDDGISYDYKNGKYSLTKFSLTKKENEFSVNISKEKNDYQVSRIQFFIKILDSEKPKSIIINNRSVNEISFMDENKNATEGFTFDNTNRQLHLKVNDSENLDIVVKYE